MVQVADVGIGVVWRSVRLSERNSAVGEEITMKKRSRWNMSVACVLALAVTCLFGLLAQPTDIDFHGSAWAGIEWIEEDRAEGGWIGGEVYLTFLAGRLALEFKIEESIYSTIDRSFNFGLRGISSNFSLGTGVGFNTYDAETWFEILDLWRCYKYVEPYPKGYLWASAYNEFVYIKVYLEATEGMAYSKTSFLVDVRSKPLGYATSYAHNVGPGGIYEELRGDLSASLFYPCFVCWESEYDCDFRGYVGGRIYSFFNPTDLYRGDWQGWLGGLRLIAPLGEMKLETQRLYKEDTWGEGWETKIIFSGSVKF